MARPYFESDGAVTSCATSAQIPDDHDYDEDDEGEALAALASRRGAALAAARDAERLREAGALCVCHSDAAASNWLPVVQHLQMVWSPSANGLKGDYVLRFMRSTLAFTEVMDLAADGDEAMASAERLGVRGEELQAAGTLGNIPKHLL